MALSKIDSLLDERSTECCVCLRDFSDPRMLPCSHTFCCECIQGLQAQTSWSGTIIHCPVCRTSCQLPAGGAREFPRNSFADMCRRMKETFPYMGFNVVEPEADESSIRCANWDEKDEHEAATGFCKACADYLCRQCQIMHHRQKVFRSHEMVPISDITPESAKAAQARLNTNNQTNKPKCQTHAQYLILHCDTCCKPICHECCVDDHKGHSYRELSTVALGLKTQLESADTPLTKAISHYDVLLQELSGKEDYTKNALREMAKSLDESAVMVQARVSAVKQEFAGHETTVMARFRETKGQLQMLKSEGEGLRQKVQDICEEPETERDVRMANEAPALLDGMRKLLQIIPDTVDVDLTTNSASFGVEGLAGHVTYRELDSRLPPQLGKLMNNLKHCGNVPDFGGLGEISSMTTLQNFLCVFPKQKAGSMFRLETSPKGVSYAMGMTDPNTPAAFSNTANAKVCTVGENYFILAYPQRNVTGTGTRTTLNLGQLASTSSSDLCLLFSLYIEGEVKGISSDHSDSVLLTMSRPKEIAIYAMVRIGPKPSLVWSQTVALPSILDTTKAVRSGEYLAVLAREQQYQMSNNVVWVDQAGTIRNRWPKTGETFNLVDITQVSQQHLLVSDLGKNRICLLDASGQLVSEFLGSPKNFDMPRLVHWDRQRAELYVECRTPQQNSWDRQLSRASELRVYKATQEGVPEETPQSSVKTSRSKLRVYKTTQKGVPEETPQSVKTSCLKLNLQLPKN